MDHNGIRTRNFWLPNPGDAHIYASIKALNILQYASP